MTPSLPRMVGGLQGPRMGEGACIPFPPGGGTGPSPGTLGLQGEGLSADWTPPAHSDDAGPHCGRNCDAPGFHYCLALTVLLQTFGSTRALDLAHSDPTLLLSQVAQYSHSPQYPNSHTLPSTPELPLSPVPQLSHSTQYTMHKEEALTQRQVTGEWPLMSLPMGHSGACGSGWERWPPGLGSKTPRPQ